MDSNDINNDSEVLTSFDVDDIGWSDGQTLYNWWNSARKNRPFPARRDFSPANMTPLLPTIQLIDVGDETRHYSVRLVGTKITEVLGFDPTGTALDDIPNTAKVRTLYDWVVDNQKPAMKTNLPITWADKEYRTFSTIILPLGPEGQEVSMLLMHFYFGEI